MIQFENLFVKSVKVVTAALYLFLIWAVFFPSGVFVVNELSVWILVLIFIIMISVVSSAIKFILRMAGRALDNFVRVFTKS